MENVTKVGPIQSVVATLKVIARDALRAELIAVRLTKIAGLNASIADNTANIASLNEKIAQAKYDISKIDSANPSAAKLTKIHTEDIANYESRIVYINKSTDELNKGVTEQNKGIADIEAGTTKVCADELAVRVDKLIAARSKALAEKVA